MDDSKLENFLRKLLEKSGDDDKIEVVVSYNRDGMPKGGPREDFRDFWKQKMASVISYLDSEGAEYDPMFFIGMMGAELTPEQIREITNYDEVHRITFNHPVHLIR